MKVYIAPSSVGDSSHHQILATYIVNDVIAIDAGSLGLVSPMAVQRKVQHVFLSHCHLDHLATLPIFIDNVYVQGPDCPTVWGHPFTLEAVQQDLFNDRIWPDMIRLSAEESPFLRLNPLTLEQPVEVEGMRVTPIELKHVVPTVGFLIEEIATGVAILFVSDTRASDRIWEVANQCPGLRAVFLEASFPNAFRWLADKAAHLTPELFGEELKKLKKPVSTYIIHVKVAFEEQILPELHALGLNDLHMAEPGTTLEFH